MLHQKMASVRHALRGVCVAWQEEFSFRAQVYIAVFVVIWGITFDLAIWEWEMIVLLFGTVLSAEAFNTALEEFCDMVKDSPDPHVGKIKDLAAGAVLIASLASAVVGCIVFYPHIMALL